jgi:hypothetical protein
MIKATAELFDEAWYQSSYPDVAAAGISGLLHYVNHGWSEGRNPHPLFDEAWYQSSYPDVAAAGIPGLLHYVNHGWSEGRNPHPLFSTKWFRSIWKDRPDNRNDLIQYLQFDSPPEISPHPAINESWYRDKYLSVIDKPMTSAEHYVRTGHLEGCSTSQNCDRLLLQKIEAELRQDTCA